MAENNNYPDTVDSRSVDIIETIINQEEYDIPPQSRLEEVLLELKEAIEEGGGGSGNIYRTTTALTDGATTNPITVDDESVTVESGDFAIYNTQEFIFDGTQWNLLGDRVGLGELAYLDRSDMGELAMKDADDIHKEISDVEYEALPAAKKNDGTEYFVYETEEDNRTITAYDSNGDFLYTLTMYGGAASDISLESKVTTPPTIVAPNPFGAGGFIFKGTFADGNTYYFNGIFSDGRTGYSVANYSERIADAYGTNMFFAINGNRFTLMSAPNTAWISSIHIPGYDESSFEYGAVATGNRYIKAYDKSYGDITIDQTPTQGSSNAVSSGGVYTALQGVGGFTRTVLYDSGGYDKYAPFQTDVSLLDNLSNYDFIVVSVGTSGDNTRLGRYECDSAVYDVQLLLRNDYNAHYAGYGSRWCDIHFTNTTFNILNSDAPSETSSLKPCVYFIVGYKFG